MKTNISSAMLIRQCFLHYSLIQNQETFWKSYFNRNIKLSVETEINNELNYFNIEIIRKANNIETIIYYKPVAINEIIDARYKMSSNYKLIYNYKYLFK